MTNDENNGGTAARIRALLFVIRHSSLGIRSAATVLLMASLPSSVVALIPLDGFEPPIVQMRWPASSGLWRHMPRVVCWRINHIADGLLSTA